MNEARAELRRSLADSKTSRCGSVHLGRIARDAPMSLFLAICLLEGKCGGIIEFGEGNICKNSEFLFMSKREILFVR